MPRCSCLDSEKKLSCLFVDPALRHFDISTFPHFAIWSFGHFASLVSESVVSCSLAATAATYRRWLFGHVSCLVGLVLLTVLRNLAVNVYATNYTVMSVACTYFHTFSYIRHVVNSEASNFSKHTRPPSSCSPPIHRCVLQFSTTLHSSISWPTMCARPWFWPLVLLMLDML